MNRSILAFLLITLMSPAVFATDTYHSLLRFDANGDGRLTESELTVYFTDQKNADPADATVDLLTKFACTDCTSIAVLKAAVALDRNRQAPSPPEAPIRPCDFFTVNRTVSDDPNPRAPESEFPAIFSYLRDKHADDTDQLNILGSVKLLDCAKNAGDPKLLNITYGGALGIDSDVNGSAKPSENTIEGSLPLFWRWVSKSAGKPLTGFSFTITPKFSTDRAFDREVYEVAIKTSIRSPWLLRMGLISNVKRDGRSLLATWWQPTVQYEAGDVADPAGNEKLEKLKGNYGRWAPRIDVIVWPCALNDRIALKANMTQRFNVDGASHSYLEATATYDITASGSLAFTAVFRHGRKAPDFAAKDQWLIGIGVQH